MKKILLLTSRLPYPPIGGDKLKNYYLVKILSRYYDVHLITVTNEKLDRRSKEFIEEHTKNYKVFTKKKQDFLFSLSRSMFNKEPMQVNYYYFHDVQKYIAGINDADLIIATLIRTSKYALHSDKPKIFDMADSIGQNYKRSLQNVKSFFWKLIYKYEADRLLKYEKETIANFDKTLMFNREEMTFFNMPHKIRFIPHGVNEELLVYEKNDSSYEKVVAFFGKMDYQPNIDAVLWFMDNVFQHLDKDLTFCIVGAKPTSKILELQDKYKNVEVTGFVDDPYVILKSALCIVAPMQTGAGIQNKILETMALGTVNIVSTLAANPIAAKNRQDYIVLDEAKAIADEIKSIYKDTNKYGFYRQNSRKFIKKNFTWSIYEKVYKDTIEEILNDHTH